MQFGAGKLAIKSLKFRLCGDRSTSIDMGNWEKSFTESMEFWGSETLILKSACILLGCLLSITKLPFLSITHDTGHWTRFQRPESKALQSCASLGRDLAYALRPESYFYPYSPVFGHLIPLSSYGGHFSES